MNEKIRQHLIKYAKSKGWDTTDKDLMEIVTDANSVWEGKRDEHRWYTLVSTVVCVDGVFLQYNYCDVHSEESSVEDCIGGYKLEDVIEVEPKEVVMTIYVPKEMKLVPEIAKDE